MTPTVLPIDPSKQEIWNRFHYQQTIALTQEIRDLRARNLQLQNSLMLAVKTNVQLQRDVSGIRSVVDTIERIVQVTLGALHTLIETFKISR